jgi:hypothetical protein
VTMTRALDTGPPIENREIPLCLETSLLYVKKSDTVTHPTFLFRTLCFRLISGALVSPIPMQNTGE